MINFGEATTAALVHRAKREKLQLHVASYGGSGTVFTVEFLNQQVRTITPLWHALLNHYAVPLPLGIPRLYLMADPPTAYASLVRRDNIRSVSRHMHGGQYGQDAVEGMETFFEHWTKASPLVFVKYEALYDHLKDISEALGVNFRVFPPRRPRKSQTGNYVPEKLLKLRERFEEFPDYYVAPMHERRGSELGPKKAMKTLSTIDARGNPLLIL
jgi:hypothetical protein